MADKQWQTGLQTLRRDNRSGSAEIESRALELLRDVVSDSIPGDARTYREWLLRISRELVAAQPSMAGLFRLVNDMLWACEDTVGGENVRLAALNFLQGRQVRSEAALDALAQAASKYLAQYGVIMTYSRSSTVLRAVTAMAEQDRRVQVLCSESRPMCEGQTLASELGWAGIDVALGIDMALFGWLPEADALVLGADSVSDAGVVNKVGTAQLARAAAERGIPRIVLCAATKFLPHDYLLDHGLRVGDPEEIMPISSKNVTVRNVYFEVTPLELISALITEKGPQDPSRLKEGLAQLRTYPGLLGTRVGQ